jgi:hypothetical protein
MKFSGENKSDAGRKIKSQKEVKFKLLLLNHIRF